MIVLPTRWRYVTRERSAFFIRSFLLPMRSSPIQYVRYRDACETLLHLNDIPRAHIDTHHSRSRKTIQRSSHTSQNCLLPYKCNRRRFRRQSDCWKPQSCNNDSWHVYTWTRKRLRKNYEIHPGKYMIIINILRKNRL